MLVAVGSTPIEVNKTLSGALCVYPIDISIPNGTLRDMPDVYSVGGFDGTGCGISKQS